MRKINLLVFLVPLLLFACAAPQEDISATSVPSEIVSVTAAAPVVVDQISTPKLTPKHNDLIFVEFFAVTWVDCKEMNPIVNGLKKNYKHCMKLERVNYHEWTAWHELLNPIGSPEFVLLDSAKQVIYYWFGVIPAEDFSEILDPLCFD